jgi:hypothetical protein
MDKSIWQTIFGGKSEHSGSTREPDTNTPRCPNGHPNGAGWTECPYCTAEKNQLNRSSTQSDAIGGATGNDRASQSSRSRTADFSASSVSSSGGGERQRTRTLGPEDSKPPSDNGSRRRVTTPFEEEKRRPPADPPDDSRLLTGIVFTYSRSRTGRLFRVYAGRNYAGTAQSTREGEEVGVLVTEDTTMSGTHFLILCQAGKYRICDCNSTNGTFVNGEQTTPQGLELEDNAHILAGNTLFVFKKLIPPTPETERKPEGYQPVPVTDAQGNSI